MRNYPIILCITLVAGVNQAVLAQQALSTSLKQPISISLGDWEQDPRHQVRQPIQRVSHQPAPSPSPSDLLPTPSVKPQDQPTLMSFDCCTNRSQNCCNQGGQTCCTQPKACQTCQTAPVCCETKCCEPQCGETKCCVPANCCEEEESPFSFRGWLSGGITYNPDKPLDRFNGPVTFNDRANELMMNQFYLIAERAIEADGCNWDFGFRIDTVFGTDSRFTKATGLEWNTAFAEEWNSQNRRFYQFALPQFYGEIALPVGAGLKAKIGHFYTIIGNEVVTAPDNFFYSHAYSHQYGEPFTHTGLLLSYPLGENLTITGGVVHGWDNFWDNNDKPSIIGGFSATSADEKSTLALSFITGPEQTGNNDNNRIMYSVVFSRQVTDNFRYIFQHDFGHDDNAVAAGVDAVWYGVNQYFLYTINECWSAGLRLEWFRDDNGARVVTLNNATTTGPRTSPLPANPGLGVSYSAITAGLNWSPIDNLVIRPEARWDWSNASGGSYSPFNAGTSGSQFLLGTDVIYSF